MRKIDLTMRWRWDGRAPSYHSISFFSVARAKRRECRQDLSETPGSGDGLRGAGGLLGGPCRNVIVTYAPIQEPRMAAKRT